MINDTKMTNFYKNYLRCGTILKIIGKKQCTVPQIFKKTKIPITSIYRIINSLLQNNVIIVSKTKVQHASRRPPKIFKMKRGKI